MFLLHLFIHDVNFIVYFLPLLQCQFYCYKFFYLLMGLFLALCHDTFDFCHISSTLLIIFSVFGCSVLWHMRSSFLSRDWNHSACTEILVLTTGPWGSPDYIFLEYIFVCAWLKLSQIYFSYRKYVVFHINFKIPLNFSHISLILVKYAFLVLNIKISYNVSSISLLIFWQRALLAFLREVY